jgi:hypothetical protein
MKRTRRDNLHQYHEVRFSMQDLRNAAGAPVHAKIHVDVDISNVERSVDLVENGEDIVISWETVTVGEPKEAKP